MQLYKSKRAVKQLDKLDAVTRQRLNKEIEVLRDWPGVRNVKALAGDRSGSFRLRVGDWRILFFREDDTIVIADVKNRKEAYK